MHTEQGQNSSAIYNRNIREHTIHRAMIDHLRTPPKEFEVIPFIIIILSFKLYLIRELLNIILN